MDDVLDAGETVEGDGEDEAKSAGSKNGYEVEAASMMKEGGTGRARSGLLLCGEDVRVCVEVVRGVEGEGGRERRANLGTATAGGRRTGNGCFG